MSSRIVYDIPYRLSTTQGRQFKSAEGRRFHFSFCVISPLTSLRGIETAPSKKWRGRCRRSAYVRKEPWFFSRFRNFRMHVPEKQMLRSNTRNNCSTCLLGVLLCNMVRWSITIIHGIYQVISTQYRIYTRKCASSVCLRWTLQPRSTESSSVLLGNQFTHGEYYHSIMTNYASLCTFLGRGMWMV